MKIVTCTDCKLSKEFTCSIDEPCSIREQLRECRGCLLSIVGKPCDLRVDCHNTISIHGSREGAVLKM